SGGSRGHHVLRRISNEVKETATSLPLSLSRPLIHPAVCSLATPCTVFRANELPSSDVRILGPAHLPGQVDARWQVRAALSFKRRRGNRKSREHEQDDSYHLVVPPICTAVKPPPVRQRGA